MNKLFVKFGIFSIIVISALFVSSTMRQRNIELQESVYRLPDKKSILVFGDSHTACGIDGKLCPEFVNFSVGAESYYYNYLKIQKVFEMNKDNLKNISCIVLTYHQFSCYSHRDSMFIQAGSDHFFTEYRMFHQRYKDSPYFFNLHIDKMENFKQYLIAVSNLYNKADINNFINGRTRKSINDNMMGGLLTEVDQFKDDWAINVPKYIGAPEQFESKFGVSRQPEILERIAKMVHDHGIPLVLLNVPCHKSFTSHIYDRLECFTDSIALNLHKKYNATYLDYIRHPYPDSLYSNSDHINKRGAAAFTPMLRDTLTSLGLY